MKAEVMTPRYWRRLKKKERAQYGDMIFLGTIQAGVGSVWDKWEEFQYHSDPAKYPIIRYIGRPKKARKS